MSLSNTSMYPVIATLLNSSDELETGEWIENKPIQFLVKAPINQLLDTNGLNSALNSLTIVSQDDSEYGSKVIFSDNESSTLIFI